MNVHKLGRENEGTALQVAIHTIAQCSNLVVVRNDHSCGSSASETQMLCLMIRQYKSYS